MKRRLSGVILRNMMVTITLLATVMVGLLVYMVRQDINGLMMNETQNTLRIIERQINNYLGYPISELNALKAIIEDDGSDAFDYDRHEHLDQTIHSFYHVDLLDFEGKVIEVVGKNQSQIGFDYSKSPAYTMIKTSIEDLVIGEVLYDSVEEKPSLTIGGKYEGGYMIGYLNLSIFSRIFQGVNLDNGYIAVVDRKGNYLAHTKGNLVDERAVDPNYAALSEGRLMDGDQVTYQGKDYIIQTLEVGIADIRIIAYQSMDDFNVASLRMVYLGLLVVLITLPLALFIVLRMSKNIDHSFNELNSITQQIANGVYAIEKSTLAYGEFNGLLGSFVHMSDEIHGREEEINNLTAELEENYFETVVLLAKAIEAKDTYTGNHCERVTEYAMMLGEALNLPAEDLRELRIGSTLHDIGKIGIPESVLNKRDPLTEDEFMLIKSHSMFGYNIIKDLSKMLGAKEIILYHHEKYDGTGYPIGLVATDIPKLARITMIADAYDAMISERPYRKGFMTEKEALQEIKRCAGTHFDPMMAHIFVNMLGG